MSRGLTAGMQSAAAAPVVHPRWLAKLVFDSQTLRLWNGDHTLTWDDGSGDGPQSWTPVAGAGAVEFPSERNDLESGELVLTLSGIPGANVSMALGEPYANRPAHLWFALLDDGGALVSDPVKLFTGFMDGLTYTSSGEASDITLTCVSDVAELERPFERRWTDEDQRQDYPGDRGYEYISALQRVPVAWGGGVR